MSDTALAILETPAGPPAATKVRVPATAKGKEIRGPLKVALDLLVYGDADGKRYDWRAAAREANYSLQSMRKAFERPHVLAYLREQKQVFRTHAAAGNIHRAIEIRDQNVSRTAAIQAIRYLDGISEKDAAREAAARGIVPGVVVKVVVGGGERRADETVIEVNPMGVPEPEAAPE